jgi:hypothetical protein
MNRRTIHVCLLFAAVGYCFAARGVEPGDARGRPQQQTAVESGHALFDPLETVTASFPRSIKLKNRGRLLEFCPDETCDEFVASNDVSVATMKDFAYLYIYYFSDYLVYLPEWRNHNDAKNTAERVLSKPEYRSCKKDDSREAARCVLLELSRNGKIKLLSIRYDEGARNVVPENIAEQLSEKKSAPKH